MPLAEADLDYLDAEIDREVAIFRGQTPTIPARTRPQHLGVAELLLGGAAVGILLVALIAWFDDGARRRRARSAR